MIRNIGNTDKCTKLINDFFKGFKNESLVWTAYLWTFRRGYSKSEYLYFLNKHHNFELITQFLKNDFLRYDKDELEDFLKECLESRLSYIQNEDLNFLKNQDRICWFIINNIEDGYQYIKDKNYKYINPYFSLLFLIHTELNGNKITLSDIRKNIEILDEQNNPIKQIKNYINDKNFIDWSLDYTDKKFYIKIQPNFKPKDNNEKLSIFMAYWDNKFLINKYKCIIEINTLKKAWQQKQFRDKGGLKKPYHLPLTKKTKSQLEALAEKMDISESKTLERLIEDAYNHEMLDNKGKTLY